MKYEENVWYVWNGESMKPSSIHDKSIVEFIWHDESTSGSGCDVMQVGWNDVDEKPAWRHIIKFRVIKEHKEPREFWIDLKPYGDSPVVSHAPMSGSYIHVREVIE